MRPLNKDAENVLKSILYAKGDEKLICVQIRLGRSSSLPQDAEMVISRNRGNLTSEVLEFSKNLSDTHGGAKVFVTTDSEDVRQEAKSFLRNIMIETEGVITHIDRSNQDIACSNLKKVMIDFHILGMCDISIISNSGFGFFGNLRRKRPYKDLYLYCRGIHKIGSKSEWDKARWRNLPC
ncbi:hypothetical protein ACOME3_002490 [Neoechinorhynchus agilis]